MSVTTHCTKKELSAYTNDRFSTTERSFQPKEQSFQDNERSNRLAEWTIVQDKERNDHFYTMNDPFKTTNGTIVYTKEWKGTIVYGTERSFEHNEMERNNRFNTTERTGTIVSSQRNGNRTPSERKLNGFAWNGRSVARDTNRNFYWCLM